MSFKFDYLFVFFNKYLNCFFLFPWKNSALSKQKADQRDACCARPQADDPCLVVEEVFLAESFGQNQHQQHDDSHHHQECGGDHACDFDGFVLDCRHCGRGEDGDAVQDACGHPGFAVHQFLGFKVADTSAALLFGAAVLWIVVAMDGSFVNQYGESRSKKRNGCRRRWVHFFYVRKH